jgi:hypothetical protein
VKCTHCNGFDFDTASSPSTGRATCRGCGSSAEFPPIGDNLTATEQAELKYSNHTPGPWTIPGSANLVGTENPRRLIAETHGENSTANARLIAAAPELLASLEYLMAHRTTAEADCDEAMRCGVAQARARLAIAQAKGNPQP